MILFILPMMIWSILMILSYCLVVWMFHSHINRLHERALRVVVKEFDSSFEELLWRDSSATLHQRNLQKIMTEIFKVKTGIALELMKVVFEFTDVPYNLRNKCKCSHRIPCTGRYGIETASSTGPKLWEKVSTEIKNSKYLDEFKARIKGWVLKNCPCKICIVIVLARYVNYSSVHEYQICQQIIKHVNIKISQVHWYSR